MVRARCAFFWGSYTAFSPQTDPHRMAPGTSFVQSGFVGTSLRLSRMRTRGWDFGSCSPCNENPKVFSNASPHCSGAKGFETEDRDTNSRVRPKCCEPGSQSRDLLKKPPNTPQIRREILATVKDRPKLPGVWQITRTPLHFSHKTDLHALIIEEGVVLLDVHLEMERDLVPRIGVVATRGIAASAPRQIGVALHGPVHICGPVIDGDHRTPHVPLQNPMPRAVLKDDPRR